MTRDSTPFSPLQDHFSFSQECTITLANKTGEIVAVMKITVRAGTDTLLHGGGAGSHNELTPQLIYPPFTCSPTSSRWLWAPAMRSWVKTPRSGPKKIARAAG